VGKTKSLFVVVYVLDPERKGIQYLLVGGGELTIFVVFIGPTFQVEGIWLYSDAGYVVHGVVGLSQV